MAASPAASSRRSPASSADSLKRSNEQTSRPSSPSMPIDTLVNHLLAAKRSLSSMTLVLRANDLATAAGHAHEDTAILTAQAGFLRRSILDQAAILVRVRRSLQVTYDWGKKDFKMLIKAMDEVDGELGDTMEMLRGTEVHSGLRPKGEDRKTLLDFVDEASVHGMREAMKKSIQELQGIQQSFDGDLLRFDTDVRNLKKVIFDSPTPQHNDSETPHMPTTELLFSMVEHSTNMAQLLASLTTHFDMCVTAIRTTEGAAALARRKAAEVTQSQGGDSVSISGVIAEQESNVSDLVPETSSDRAEMFRVVVQDAEEVDDVVQEIQERLSAMEQDNAELAEHGEQARTSYIGMLEAYAALEEIGDRLADYLAAEEDFQTRWNLEKDAVFGKLQEMKDMRDFYEGYGSAYSGLVLEVERRRTVEDKVQSIWRKAQENVDKIVETDRQARDTFRQDVGEFLPTDLWAGMQGPMTRWEVVQAGETGDDGTGSGSMGKQAL